MKQVSDMTRLEFAGFVSEEFRHRKINVVLSGGSCVSIYSREKYVSMDLDFVNAGFTKRALIRATMASSSHKRPPLVNFLIVGGALCAATNSIGS